MSQHPFVEPPPQATEHAGTGPTPLAPAEGADEAAASPIQQETPPVVSGEDASVPNAPDTEPVTPDVSPWSNPLVAEDIASPAPVESFAVAEQISETDAAAWDSPLTAAESAPTSVESSEVISTADDWGVSGPLSIPPAFSADPAQSSQDFSSAPSYADPLASPSLGADAPPAPPYGDPTRQYPSQPSYHSPSYETYAPDQPAPMSPPLVSGSEYAVYTPPAMPYSSPQQGYLPAPYAQNYPAIGLGHGIDPRSGLPFSRRSKVVAGLLGIFLGGFGVGRFYTGHMGIGLAQLIVTVFTLGAGALWGFIDGIYLLAGDARDADGLPLS